MLHIETLTSRIQKSDLPKTRRQKKEYTSQAQQYLNNKLSSFNLELDLACNYIPGDLILTLTYNDEHLPFRRQQCFSNMKYFRKKLSEEYKKHGDGRWHHHAVINAADIEYQTIVDLWGRGNIKFQRLLLGKHKDPKNPKTMKEYSYAGLATYMTKERPDKPGQRCWTCTRTAKHPVIETALVDANTTLNPPPGSQLLSTKKEKEHGARLEYIKYLNAELPHRNTSMRRKKKK